MEWHQFDKGGKWLIQHHGDSILRLGGVGEVVAWRAVQAEVVQPGQLPDGLLEVQLVGRAEPVYVIVELATKAERRLTKQLVRDLLLVYLDRDVLPEVVTLILRQRGQYRAARQVQVQSHLKLTSLEARWHIVEMWTVSAEDLLAANDVGLIPWVPLCKFAGPPEPLLKRCRERIEQQAQPQERMNLLAVTQVMTRLRYTDPQLLTLLGGSQIMIESTLIGELLAKNTAETKRKDILRFLRGRFDSVPDDLAAALEGIQKQTRLDELVDVAATCPDLEAFRASLASAKGLKGSRKQPKRGRQTKRRPASER